MGIATVIRTNADMFSEKASKSGKFSSHQEGSLLALALSKEVSSMCAIIKKDKHPLTK